MIKIGLVDFAPEDKVLSILDKNDIVKAKYCIDKNDIWKHSLMSENYIEISFFLNTYVAFNRTDYILWEGDKFALRNDYQPEQIKKRKYKYTLKFETIEMFFKDIQYYYLSQGVKEVEWRLFGNPEYFIKIAVDNANRYFGIADFKMGSIEPTEAKDILFDVNTTIFDALTHIAEEYDAEWYVTDKIIHLVNKLEYGDEVDFETEVSVLEMKRNEGDKKEQYTRILPLGSTRNIPKEYREAEEGEGVDAVYSKRLRIPVLKGSTIDAYPNMTNDEVIEGTVIFDDIYPKRVGTIESINAVQYQDKDKETGKIAKWDAYKIKDSGIDFKEEYLLPGEELRLQFVSGDLNGMDFALFFNKSGFSAEDESQNFEIVRNDDYGRPLPNATLKPNVGDKYVLYGFNIAMVGDQYVPLAEQELYDEAVEWLEKQLRDTSVYECSTAIQYFTQNRLDLDLGQRVRLLLDQGSRSSRIMGFEKKLNNVYDTTYIVGDNPTYSLVARIEQDIKELKVEGLIQGQGGNIYIIKNIDSTRPTDFNVLSSKRSLNSFHRKDKTDSTDYLQKFNKGAEFGQYGKKGAYINEEGIGDFEKVVSKDTDFKRMGADGVVANTATINELIAKLAQVHKLEVTDTATILKSVVKEYLTSEKFVSGFAGEGFRIAQAINGDWNLEIDNLIVRKLFNVFEIVVQKISHQGGVVIRSVAGGKITKVVDGGSYWRCEHDGIDDFAKDDQVLCQNFKVLTGDAEVKRYWRLATSAGKGYVNLSKTDMEANSSIPKVGDEIVQLGNRTNINRQSAQIVSVVGADAPYLDNYAGINSYSLKDKLVTREGNLNGIVDKDFGQLKGYGLYANNAYLKGILRLTNGKTVEQEILNTNNNVEQNRLELGGEIDKAKADAKNANNKIDNLEIGGRNLYTQSEATYSQLYREKSVDDSFYARYSFSVAYGANKYKDYSNIRDNRVYFPNKLFKSGQQYILHIEYKSLPNSNSKGGENIGSLKFNYTDGSMGSVYAIRVDKEKPLYGYIEMISDPNKDVDFIGGSYWLGGDFYGNIKLEKGNKATDWSPAPEDAESYTDKKTSEIRTEFDVIEGQINMNVAKTEQLVKQTTGLVEETKQTASQVNQTATEINQNVSRAEESATRAETAETNINTKADSIVMEASKQSAEKAIEGLEIGGRNLVVGSKDLSGNEYKENNTKQIVDGFVVAHALPPKDTDHTNAIQFKTEHTGFETYTLSFYAKSDIGNTSMNCFFYNKNTTKKGVTSQGNISKAVDGNVKFNINDEWHKYWVTWEHEPYSDGTKSIIIGRTYKDKIYIYGCKLEKGNKATDWSPAPEDIDQQIQATNSKLELLSDKFSVEVAKTDGTQKELTSLKQDHNSFKIQVKEDINGAIDSNNEVIKSSFEMKDNKISLLGSEIDITGKVTFTALNKESQDKINTANINANNALLDAGKAQTSADNANSSITALKTNLGDLAYEDKVEKAKLGSTVIEGGFLNTDLLQAGSIKADKLDVSQIADNTMIGDSFVFVDGCFISQEGVDKDGNFSNNWKDFKNGNFIPNTVLRGKTGEVISLKGKFGLLDIVDSNLIGRADDGSELVRITGDEVPDGEAFDAPFDIEDVSFPRETGDYPFSFENGKLTYIEVMYSVDIDLKESGEYRLDECSCDFFEIVNTWNGQNEINRFHITYSADVRIIMGKDVLLDKTFKYTDRWDGVSPEFYTAKKGRCRVNIVFTIIFDRPDGGDYIAKTITGIRALSHKATPYKATFIGSDGLYSSFTTKEFLHYKAGQGITIRSGDYGLRISQNGIQKWNGSKWVAANI